MKKYLFVIFVLFLSCSKKVEKLPQEEQPVTLTFISWRNGDEERMDKINKTFSLKYPNINIKYKTIKESIYDDELNRRIDNGLDADLLMLRSFDFGESIYNKGVLLNLNGNVSRLKVYPKTAIDAWSSGDDIYGLPIAGVLHGVFFRKSAFKKWDIKEPETWNEFISELAKIRNKRIVPLAQGTKDPWTLYEVVFSGLGPNFYGGEKSRQQLIEKKIRITDIRFLNALTRINELSKFFPPNYRDIDYNTMQEMFIRGEAPVFIGGSWETGLFIDRNIIDDVGFFAPPVNKVGDKLQYNFHVDMGVGINKHSSHIEECLTYLNWLSTTEFAQLFMNELPGFFSFTPGVFSLDLSLTQKIYSYVPKSETTVRTFWEGLSSSEPSGNTLSKEALKKMYDGEFSPEEALEYIDQGLSWYY